ncbi:hypothetical protein ACJX0J_040315 [Zea mays]
MRRLIYCLKYGKSSFMLEIIFYSIQPYNYSLHEILILHICGQYKILCIQYKYEEKYIIGLNNLSAILYETLQHLLLFPPPATQIFIAFEALFPIFTGDEIIHEPNDNEVFEDVGKICQRKEEGGDDYKTPIGKYKPKIVESIQILSLLGLDYNFLMSKALKLQQESEDHKNEFIISEKDATILLEGKMKDERIIEQDKYVSFAPDDSTQATILQTRLYTHPLGV